MKKNIFLLCAILLVITLISCGKPYINEQTTESEEFSFPSISELLSAINDSNTVNGNVEITADIRQQFNKIGNDYLFFG